jgi:hypothetical protein
VFTGRISHLFPQCFLDQSCQSNFEAVMDADPYPHNSRPRSITAGDFNHNNLLDIVVVNSHPNNIGIFLNYGNGTFAPQMAFTTGDFSTPLSIIAGDFNNDTHLDLAAASYDTHNINIFLGYGDGTFASPLVFPTGVSRPVSMALSDFNNDQYLDIVVTHYDTNEIRILFGYGNGSFENQITYSTGYDSLPNYIVVDDFNNDLNLDIAVANYGTNNVGVFLGYGNGTFTVQTTYSAGPRSSPYSIAVDDFNKDHQLDIAVANSGTNNVGIFLGDGNGSFLSQNTYSISPGSRPYSIIIGDFNQDNQLDIAVSNYDTDNISILIGYGNGSFATPTIHSTGIDSDPFGMTVGDFGNDNTSDIAVVNSGTNNVLILIGYSMVQSEYPTTYSTGTASLPNQIASGDLNNDTLIDLVVANYGTNNVGVLLGYENGSFQEQITYSTGNDSQPRAVIIIDIDNDYKLDIVVGNSNTETLGILYGYGNGIFAPVVTYPTGNTSSLRWIIANDFNNDNYLDIAFVDYSTNSIGIYLGYGNRSFGKLTTYSTGDYSRPFCVAAGDFNNDTQLDIAVVNYGTYTIGIFLGFGNGTFASFTIYSTGQSSRPRMLTIGDLNNDKHLDIVVANSGSDSVGVFFGFGNGSFNTPMTYSTGSGSKPIWVSVADLNNDHSLDIVVANSILDNVGVLLGNSLGYFSSETTYSTGFNSQPYSIAVGDFNKDKQLDVAVANYGTNNIAILLGHRTEESANQTDINGTSNDLPMLLGDYYASFRSQIIYPIGSSSHPYSIGIGDLNNDKKVDIVVTNSGNENLGILFGNGDGTFATEIFYPTGRGSSPREIIVGDFNRDNELDVAVTNTRNDDIIVLEGNGNGTFSKQITYSTNYGSDPSALTIADFNNDQYLDLVVADQGTDTIGIFFGYDYTVFSRQEPCDSGNYSGPVSVAIGDFDNDGYWDIVSANYGTNNIAIFLGLGNGTFTSMMAYANILASHPWSVAVGDFNNDKQLDITIATWGIDSIAVLLGYGNGSFPEPTLYSAGSNTRPISIAVGDFNNDLCLDITAANYGGNSIAVFFGYGDGNFRNVTTFSTGTGSQPRSVSVFDINNDTHADILVTNEGSNNVGVFLGYGDGNFAKLMTFSTGDDSAPWYAVARDFNRDGTLDLAIANYGSSNVAVLYGYGNSSFGNLQTYATGDGFNPTHVNVGDFNNDNHLDLIVSDETSSNVGIFFGYSDGKFASISIVPMGQSSSIYQVAIGDFNNDTRLDFVTADNGNNNIGVFLAADTNPFGGQTTFDVGNGSHPSSVAVGYFNNDTLLDIAITNSGTNTLGILLGYGNRRFSNMTTFSTGRNSQPSSLAIGDFNNDLLTDIVVANIGSNDIIVFIGYGNGSFSTFRTYLMGIEAQPISIDVGDFNRDYQLDIAVANYGANSVCLLFGNGDGTYTNYTWYPLGYDSQPNWIVFKDLNNDGWEDIAVANYGTDNIKILLNLC